MKYNLQQQIEQIVINQTRSYNIFKGKYKLLK
jgi:hypothetical protein